MKKMFNRTWPLVFIITIWVFFAASYVIQNKTPFPSDHQVNNYAPWSEYRNFWGPVKNSAMPDIIDQIYPWKKFTIESLKNGQIPFWNPYSFSGNIHLANYQSSVFNPLNILFFIFDFRNAWSLLILLQPLLAGLFTYVYARSLKLEKASSLIASVSFMFSGFITVWMSYGTLAYAILFLPLSLFAIETYLRTKKNRFAILLSLTIPLSFFSGHFQISIYFFSLIAAYLVFKYFISKDKHLPLKLFLFVFFGILLSMPQIIPSIEVYLETVRALSFAKSEVIPWTHLSTIISPDFFGNPVTRNNPIAHYAEWAAFTGAVPFLLGLYALFKIKKNRYVLFFALAGTLSIGLSFDTFLSDLLIALQIPAISTSAVGRVIVILSFSIAILSAFGLDFLIKDLKAAGIKRIASWTAISFLIILGLLAFAVSPYLDQETSRIAFKNSVLPAFLFSALFFGTIIAIYQKKFILVLPFMLLILTSFEMLRFSTKWMPASSKKNIFADLPITKFIEELPKDGRMIGAGQHLNNYYQTLGVDGYDPVYIQRFGEFVNFSNSAGFADPPSKGIKFSFDGVHSERAIELLGVKYIFHKAGDDGKAWSFPFEKYGGKYKVIFDDKEIRVYQAITTAPRAFITSDYEIEKDRKKILEKVFSNSNLNHIVLEQDVDIEMDGDGQGEAVFEKYSPNEVVIRTKSAKDSLLYLSDNYYPGWNAYLGSVSKEKKREILRANYTFRAVSVPKGDNTVIFKYEPESFRAGVLLFGFGTLGILITGFKSKKKSG